MTNETRILLETAQREISLCLREGHINDADNLLIAIAWALEGALRQIDDDSDSACERFPRTIKYLTERNAR